MLSIIAFASPKGGVGKSTACAALAGAFAHRGEAVHIIDLDQRKTLTRWKAKDDGALGAISLADPSPETFSDHLETAIGAGHDRILIDVAGAYEKALMLAMAKADLSIVPVKPSEPDIADADLVVRELANLYRRFGAEPLYRVLASQVQALAPNYQLFAFAELERLGLARFATSLGERAAYREIFMSGLPPHYADRSRDTVTKAIAEIDALVAEIDHLILDARNSRERAAS